MIGVLKRLRGRSVLELRTRFGQAARARVEWVQLQINPKVDYHLRPGVAARTLLDSTSTVFSRLGGAGHTARQLARALATADPDAVAEARRRTGQLLAGQVRLLGFPPWRIGDSPNWHRDPLSGLIAPRLHWSRISYLDTTVVGDHKALWEINRHQYLYAPALSFLIDGEERAFELVQRHLASWLDENPPNVGVNWASSLEVAYRAITWLWLLWLLNDAPWSESLLKRLTAAIECHALHVEQFLSTYFSPNTHLTGEALCLFYVGTLLPNSSHSNRWRRKGASILESWLDRQVHPDGVYREQATLYHRYTMEIYLHYVRLAAASDWPVTDEVLRTLSRMMNVMRSIANGSGCIPVIGDDDGGMLFPLDGRDPEAIGGVLLAGAATLHRPELLPPGLRQPAMAYALCGVNSTDRLLEMDTQLPAWRSLNCEDGGTLVVRDGWDSDSAVCILDAGPHGYLNCAHAHADALSITLSLGAQPLFVDRGTLTYVGVERNEFRSTTSHNTMEFDGESSVAPLTPFQWGPRPPAPVATLRECAGLTLVRSTAAGHIATHSPSTHTRVVAHVRDGAWLVFDQGHRTGTNTATVRWQLATGLSAIPGGNSNFDVVTAIASLARVVMPISAKNAAVEREISGRYGHRAPATVLEASTDNGLQCLTIILPVAEGVLPAVTVTSTDRQVTRIEWVDRFGSHLVLTLRALTGHPMHYAGWVANAQLLWWIDPGPGPSEVVPGPLLIAIGASQLTSPTGQQLIEDPNGKSCRDVVASQSVAGWGIMSMTEPRPSWE